MRGEVISVVRERRGEEYGSSERGVYETVRAPLGEPAVFYKEGSEAGREFRGELDRRGLLRSEDKR